MHFEPKNMIELFARKIARNQKMFEDNMMRIDFSGMSSIPALHTFAFAVQNYEAGIESKRRDDELLEHIDILNGNGPASRAYYIAKRWSTDSGDVGIPVHLRPPAIRNTPVKLTIEQLKSEEFASLFNQSVWMPAGYSKASLLDGIVPTILGASGFNSTGVDMIVDIFQVNREAFRDEKRDDQRWVGIDHNYKLELDFKYVSTSPSPDHRWRVETKIFNMQQTGHWRVRTFFDIVYSDGKLSVSPYYGTSAFVGNLSIVVSQMRAFGGGSPVYGPYDINPPDDYTNKDSLSLAVEVYSELENVIHFGTESLIPWDAVRAGIREFLYGQKYYPVVPELMGGAEVAQTFLNMYIEDDKKAGSTVHLRRKGRSEFAEFTLMFNPDEFAEENLTGILVVEFYFSDYDKLMNLDLLTDLIEWPGEGCNGTNIKFTIPVKGGVAEELRMGGNYCTLRTLRTLLDSAVAMRQKAKELLALRDS